MDNIPNVLILEIEKLLQHIVNKCIAVRINHHIPKIQQKNNFIFPSQKEFKK